MKRDSLAQTVGVIALAAALMAGAARLQALREERYPPSAAADASLYVTSGTTARRLTVGYNALAADLYWIRALQYYGDAKLKLARNTSAPGGAGPSDGYPLLYPLLDLTTSLDPRFTIAYRFGAIFLAETFPSGAGRPDLAVALLEKGLRDRPDKWEYMQDIGFVHYWWRHDYKAAAAAFNQASQVEGAPWFLRSLAATTLVQGGDRASSRTMWESIRATAEIDWLRKDAEKRLMQLDAMDFMSELQSRLDRYYAGSRAKTRDWAVLIRAGIVPGVPADAAGVPYEIDEAGRVQLSSRSPLFPLPEEPQHIVPAAS